MIAQDEPGAEGRIQDESIQGLFNASRATDFMRRYDLDAVVATTPVNVTYLSSYYCPLDSVTKEYMLTPGGSDDRALETYAIVPREDHPALVVPALLAVNANDLWIRDHYTYGDTAANRGASAPEALAAALRARGLELGRIGLEGGGLSARSRDMIGRLLPGAELHDCTSLLRLVRAVKTPAEIERLTRAAQIAEEGLRAALENARVGDAVTGLAQRFKRHAVECGAEFDHFAYGVRGFGIAMSARHILDEQDVMYVDAGCAYEHRYSDTGLTLALRQPPPRLRDRYRRLADSVRAGAESLRPGIPSSAVWMPMRAQLPRHDQRTLLQGHGIGIEAREYPLVSTAGASRIRDECVDESADLILEEGMVVNLEASIFVPGEASLHVERSFVVGCDGSRPLADQPRDDPYVPAS